MTDNELVPAGAMATAIDALWATFGDRSSLMPYLEADAVMARARTGELKVAIPRLAELVVTDALVGVEPTELFEMLSSADWQSWPAGERSAIGQFADTWWTFTRSDEDPLVEADTVLACLAHLDVPLVRWLGPWLTDLDGPGAGHLATTVIERLTAKGWATRPDERLQILAWTRTEPVIVGLTLIGGVHLDEGQLGQALDLML